jgi:thioredoxin reductase (NADPH)
MSQATRHCRLLILGSGPAGYTAAVYAARANLKPVLITGMAQGGQLMTTTDVDNWPADAQGVQGPELMQRFEEHARRFDTEIIFDHIHTATDRKTVHADRRLGHLHLRRADHRHRCVGAVSGPAVRRRIRRSRRFRLRDLRRLLLPRASQVAVIGGGNTAVEEALYLANIASHVTLVHRRDKLRSEKILQDKLFAKEKAGKVTIRWNCTLDESARRQSGVTGMRIREQADRQRRGPAADGRLHRHRPQAEHRAVRRPAGNGRRLPDDAGRARAMPRRLRSPASSPPATCRTISTARRAPRRAAAAWRRSMPSAISTASAWPAEVLAVASARALAGFAAGMEGEACDEVSNSTVRRIWPLFWPPSTARHPCASPIGSASKHRNPVRTPRQRELDEAAVLGELLHAFLGHRRLARSRRCRLLPA